ncbi:MAG: hypothetical protein IT329_09715 [Caldilineaceae bacterium]|nr:hypothetical protein [Caldilineaceae bacterium]
MDAGEQRYAAYLLRLWRREQDGGRLWCAALEEVHSGERRTFASLQALIAFLVTSCPEQPLPPVTARSQPLDAEDHAT